MEAVGCSVCAVIVHPVSSVLSPLPSGVRISADVPVCLEHHLGGDRHQDLHTVEEWP